MTETERAETIQAVTDEIISVHGETVTAETAARWGVDMYIEGTKHQPRFDPNVYALALMDDMANRHHEIRLARASRPTLFGRLFG